MRRVKIGLGAGLCLTLAAGCAPESWLRKPTPSDIEAVSTGNPSVEPMLNYLNTESRKIQAFQCERLELQVRSASGNGNVSGYLYCRAPHDFRLRGKALGMDEVDLGSNEEEFWFWVKRADDKLYHCSYRDFQQGGVRLPFPFQPEWIAEALGMGHYGNPTEYAIQRVGPRQDKIELTQTVTSPQGKPVKKVMVCNYNKVRPPTPQVLEHRLQDAQGKVICSATVQQVGYDPAADVTYPKVVVLSCPGDKPGERIELRMILDKVTVARPIDPDTAQGMFSRRGLRYPTYDLARGGQDATRASLQRVRGSSR
jgi:hypothetical protein